MNKDIIIIGGGAAGMMAAISAKRSQPDKSVLIIDRTFALGRKILICGAGRCNITNVNLADKIDESYHGAEDEFVHSILDKFGYKEIVDFFNELGIELYVERKTSIGKLFPVTDQAHTVVELLNDEINLLGIEVWLNTEVQTIKNINNNFEIRTNELDIKGMQVPNTNKTIQSEYLIISAGGKSYPALGSNGTGYGFAESFGHTIIEPIPSALPIEAKSNLSQLLQGQKMEMEVTSIIDGEEIKTRTDDVMFKKYGLSGPAILNISRELSVHINREHKNNAYVRLNFFPGKNSQVTRELLEDRWSRRPNQLVVNSLYGLMPNKMASAVIMEARLPRDLRNRAISDKQIGDLVNVLTNYRVKVNATRGWNEAEFTAGGVDSRELKMGTLESLKQRKLYFCGEIIDVDGDVGGFNLSWSWASGYIAGLLS